MPWRSLRNCGGWRRVQRPEARGFLENFSPSRFLMRSSVCQIALSNSSTSGSKPSEPLLVKTSPPISNVDEGGPFYDHVQCEVRAVAEVFG
jgi:hypothetical protein